jgi:hypothetical protein
MNARDEPHFLVFPSLPAELKTEILKNLSSASWRILRLVSHEFKNLIDSHLLMRPVHLQSLWLDVVNGDINVEVKNTDFIKFRGEQELDYFGGIIVLARQTNSITIPWTDREKVTISPLRNLQILCLPFISINLSDVPKIMQLPLKHLEVRMYDSSKSFLLPNSLTSLKLEADYKWEQNLNLEHLTQLSYLRISGHLSSTTHFSVKFPTSLQILHLRGPWSCIRQLSNLPSLVSEIIAPDTFLPPLIKIPPKLKILYCFNFSHIGYYILTSKTNSIQFLDLVGSSLQASEIKSFPSDLRALSLRRCQLPRPTMVYLPLKLEYLDVAETSLEKKEAEEIPKGIKLEFLCVAKCKAGFIQTAKEKFPGVTWMENKTISFCNIIQQYSKSHLKERALLIN